MHGGTHDRSTGSPDGGTARNASRQTCPATSPAACACGPRCAASLPPTSSPSWSATAVPTAEQLAAQMQEAGPPMTTQADRDLNGHSVFDGINGRDVIGARTNAQRDCRGHQAAARLDLVSARREACCPAVGRMARR